VSDLVLLAADKNIESGVSAILRRSQAMGCRPFVFRSFVHPHRDPGCFGRSAAFLAPFAKDYDRAVVIFDREGSGSTKSREAMELEVESRLSVGWNDRAMCIVVDPEIENWVWTDSPHLPTVLGWQRPDSLRDWVRSINYWSVPEIKPSRPKEALERVLRELRRPRSSAIYADLGQRVTLTRCSDPAFVKFRDTLRHWFPAAPS
jgi:hypothetical protein